MEILTVKDLAAILDTLFVLDMQQEHGQISEYENSTTGNKLLEYLNSAVLVQNTKRDLAILAEAICNMIQKSNLTFDTYTSFIDNLIKVNYFAYLEMMLKEVSQIMEESYLTPLNEEKYLYVISKKDMMPVKVHRSLQTLGNLATFRCAEDANRALEICTLWEKIRK